METEPNPVQKTKMHRENSVTRHKIGEIASFETTKGVKLKIDAAYDVHENTRMPPCKSGKEQQDYYTDVEHKATKDFSTSKKRKRDDSDDDNDEASLPPSKSCRIENLNEKCRPLDRFRGWTKGIYQKVIQKLNKKNTRYTTPSEHEVGSGNKEPIPVSNRMYRENSRKSKEVPKQKSKEMVT